MLLENVIFMPIKRLILSLIILFTGIGLYAQDTIKIMQYNLLNYGITTGYCSEANNNLRDKDESIRTVLGHVLPDILAVNEFSKVQQLQTDFLNKNLNIKGVKYWKSDNIINHAQSSIINHIFYNSDKMVLKRHNYIAAKYRDVDVYEFYFKTTTLSMGDTTKLVYVVAHLKAGSNNTDIADRNVTAQKIMNYLADNHTTDNVIISGDLNLYGADEPAYQKLTQSSAYGGALFIDPIGNEISTGSWNTGSMTDYHTQSTHSDNNGCFASGGLDDRFDLILISDEVRYGSKGLRYVTDSYEAVGNDGYHYNRSVNAGNNYAVDNEVADALYTVSDHLPVTIEMTLTNPLGIDEEQQNPAFTLFASPNPANDHVTLHFSNYEPQIVTFDVMTITGLVVATSQTYSDKSSNTHRINTSHLADGFYIVRMTGENGQAVYCKMIKQKR